MQPYLFGTDVFVDALFIIFTYFFLLFFTFLFFCPVVRSLFVSFEPDLIDYDALQAATPENRIEAVLDAGETLGIVRALAIDDVCGPCSPCGTHDGRTDDAQVLHPTA